ncbi:hypothetical protein D9758_005634 [Tetrapyrgos nigripes]|uniref:Uncharacterized protein n=1 Tax=Tetrapyrgos nigripes TaxID=182062 RepID=A0A8H5LPF4_9AGAR|nr:hypothetical protein D9758_005634 [Tetrapyrgos nigripes]
MYMPIGDRYWDNVGGPTLDAVIGNAALHARFIICGFISQYNGAQGQEYKASPSPLDDPSSLHVRFVLDEFDEVITKWLAKGEIKFKEDVDGLEKGGLKRVGEALLEVQKGGNFGKKVV